MEKDKLEKANALNGLIKRTEEGLKSLKEWENSIEDTDLWDLSITEFDDGSGGGHSFGRMEGNKELLNVIISTLEKQLSNYKERFKKL